MAKAPDAFRTISEVSDRLNTPAHVLRFWESKFSQIKPVKGAGGRRYYRPGDIDLLAGIKLLLHEQGMTIKGAKKLLREKGVKHVASLGNTEIPDSLAEETVETTEVQTSKPVEEQISKVPNSALDTATTVLTEPPKTPDPVPPRWFSTDGKIDRARLQGKKTSVEALIERLTVVRTRMASE